MTGYERLAWVLLAFILAILAAGTYPDSPLGFLAFFLAAVGCVAMSQQGLGKKK